MFISKRSIQLLRFSMDWAFFLKVVPFNHRYRESAFMSLRVEFPESKSQFVQYLFLLHLLFLTVRLCQSISAQNRSATYYVVESVYYAQFLLSSTYLISLMINGPEWIVFVNQCFHFYANIDSKYKLNVIYY
jgi:hypothetical protein